MQRVPALGVRSYAQCWVSGLPSVDGFIGTLPALALLSLGSQGIYRTALVLTSAAHIQDCLG